jgi:hypothetical protein
MDDQNNSSAAKASQDSKADATEWSNAAPEFRL